MVAIKKIPASAMRLRQGQEVYLIDVSDEPAGDKIKIKRVVNPNRYIVQDVLVSVISGGVDLVLLKVGAACVYDTISVSGNLVWATEEEALAQIKKLNSFFSERSVGECGCNPKCF